MANSITKPLLNSALKLVLIQGVVVFISAVLVFFIWGATATQSAVLGGIVALLPNLVFTVYAFRFSGARQAKQTYASFKRGSVMKFLLTIIMFALVFKFVQVVALAFFVCLY